LFPTFHLAGIVGDFVTGWFAWSFIVAIDYQDAKTFSAPPDARHASIDHDYYINIQHY